MYCRVPRKIKRYMTDPDEIEKQLKYKYNNLTLEEIKLQLNPFEALNEIRVPSVHNNRLNNQKTLNHIAPIQHKYHLQTNAHNKLNNIHLPPYSNNNGYELPKANKLPLAFKRSNPLFVVNSLIGKRYFMQRSSKTIMYKLLQNPLPIKIRRPRKNYRTNNSDNFKAET